MQRVTIEIFISTVNGSLGEGISLSLSRRFHCLVKQTINHSKIGFPLQDMKEKHRAVLIRIKF